MPPRRPPPRRHTAPRSPPTTGRSPCRPPRDSEHLLAGTDPPPPHPSSPRPPQSVSERGRGLRASPSPPLHPLTGSPPASPTALPAPSPRLPRSCRRGTTPCTGRHRAPCGVSRRRRPPRPPRPSRAAAPRRQPGTPPAVVQVRTLLFWAVAGLFVADGRCPGSRWSWEAVRWFFLHGAVSVDIDPGVASGSSRSVDSPGCVWLFLSVVGCAAQAQVATVSSWGGRTACWNCTQWLLP